MKGQSRCPDRRRTPVRDTDGTRKEWDLGSGREPHVTRQSLVICVLITSKGRCGNKNEEWDRPSGPGQSGGAGRTVCVDSPQEFLRGGRGEWGRGKYGHSVIHVPAGVPENCQYSVKAVNIYV